MSKVTVKVNGVVPLFSSALAIDGAAIDATPLSSFRIVLTAEAVPMFSPAEGLCSETSNASSNSISASPITSTSIILEVSPIAKLSVTPFRAVPPMSDGSAPSTPEPTMDHDTLCAAARLPVRVTTKVNSVVPLSPSAISAF